MSEPSYADSVVIARSPEEVYDMVSDVTRMGDWSPVCKECWWEEDGGSAAVGAQVGRWFGGRNELPERTWETRSEVVAAERGVEFAFVVQGTIARWSYTFAPVDGGTELTETWQFLPSGIELFREHFGDEADAQIADREQAARNGIPETLAAIKQAAEG